MAEFGYRTLLQKQVPSNLARSMHAREYRVMTTRPARLASIWFVLQAVLVTLWWVWLFVQPAARAHFLPTSFPAEVLLAFAVPDLLLLVLGSLAAGHGLWRGRAWSSAACWFVVGACCYATLWCTAASLRSGDAWIAVVAMAATSAGSVLATVRGAQ